MQRVPQALSSLLSGSPRRLPRPSLLRPRPSLLLVVLVLAAGCSRFKPPALKTYVYVTAKQGFLRDRIAAVSNRTGNVANGDKLEVLEHGRRFIKVRTEKGEVGWIDEKSVATGEVSGAFEALAKDHGAYPAIASAVVRDEVYMHIKPGRDTERFYRLAEGDKLKLLSRATLPRAVVPGTVVARTSPVVVKPGTPLPPPEAPAGPAMEDWWLVRDGQNRTGWIYSRMMDVDAPDTLTRYSEGQRFVGAYVLTHIYDGEAPQDEKNIPLYVAVLSPYKAGLTYDFDQVRVFTWSTKKHRYETAYREKNIEGYLPVTVSQMKDPYGKSVLAQQELPSFSYRVLAADSPPVVPDPVTGAIAPAKLITKTYRLESTTVHRIVAPGQASDLEAHPAPPPEKGKKGKKKH